MLHDSEISLHDYVSRFIPPIWVEPIASVAFVPCYTNEQYERMKQGVLPEQTTWYCKQAIESFFKELKEQSCQ